MIPPHKSAAVQKALQTAFDVVNYDQIEQLHKGLSRALVFKIMVRGEPYLLRVVTRTDDFGDPSFYYGCMKVAADYDVAPKIHYLSIEDRVSITDFVVAQPFSIEKAAELMPVIIRQLHAIPKFSLRNNYFDSMEKFIPAFSAANVLHENDANQLIGLYRRITDVYPMKMSTDWVSSHNDSKPDNVVFDGRRPWFVDWEAAFLNDPYLDLCMSANFVVMDETGEQNFLAAYFGQPATDYQRARYFLMQEILHFYYVIFLFVWDRGEKPIDVSKIARHNFRKFHQSIWEGSITMHETISKREYAMVHLDEFLRKATLVRFEESIRILAKTKTP